MTEVELETQLEAAISLMKANLIDVKSPEAIDAYKSCQDLIDWMNYIHQSELTGCGDEFLDGFRSSIVETIFCISTGLARLALFSMRSQIDICCSWLYFKDHPYEYRKVHMTSEGFMLKSAVLSYLEEFHPKFKVRFNVLQNNLGRTEKDPYRLLSAHVHSQSNNTLPVLSNFSSVVSGHEVSTELIKVQTEVTEFLGDILFACFGAKWAALPGNLVQSLKTRLPASAVSTVLS